MHYSSIIAEKPVCDVNDTNYTVPETQKNIVFSLLEKDRWGERKYFR